MILTKSIKNFLIALAVFIFTFSLVGCAQSSDDTSSDDNGDDDFGDVATQVVAQLTNEYTALNDATSIGNSAYNHEVNYFVQDNIWYYDENLNVVINEDHYSVEKISDDPLVIKYTIKDKAKWSDGQPVTAADFLLTWAAKSTNLNDEDIAVDEETGAAKPTDDQVYFDGADGYTVLIEETPTISDDLTEFTVTYASFTPQWKYLFDENEVPAHIVAKKALGIDDPTEAINALIAAIQDPVTNKSDLAKISNFWNNGYNFTSLPTDPDLLVVSGAYEITDFKQGEYITVSKRDDYEGALAGKVDTIVTKFISDQEAGRQALENGEIDIYYPDIPTQDIVEATKAIPGVETLEFLQAIYEHVDLTVGAESDYSVFSSGYWVKNGESEADAEKKALAARQAFLKALPKQEILDAVVKPANPSADALLSFDAMNDNPVYNEIITNNDSSNWLGNDTEAAKKILADAGISETLTVKFLYASQKPTRVQSFQLISEALKEVGFDVQDAGAEDWGSKLGTTDASLFAWVSTNPDLSQGKSNFVTGGQNNFTGYTNSEIDALWDEIGQTDDANVQAELVAKSDSILYNTGFGVPLFQWPGFIAWNSDKLSGFNSISLAPVWAFQYWTWEVKS